MSILIFRKRKFESSIMSVFSEVITCKDDAYGLLKQRRKEHEMI